MIMSLPGIVIPGVSAAMPPRLDEEKPPQLPVRAKAALTISGSKAVFVIEADGGVLHLRFLRDPRRIVAHGPQQP
jgi:hypothetical protein